MSWSCNVRAIRVGRFSARAEAAVERQVERDLLEEAIEANGAVAGPIPAELRDEAAELFRAVMRAPELREDARWLGRKP